MQIIKPKDKKEFQAGDTSILHEILNPVRLSLPINFSLAQATVKSKQKTLRHRLRSSEVYYILRGSGMMHIDDEQEPVCEQDTILIPPGSTQYIENTGAVDLVFLCIVDPAWQPAIEEILE